MCRAFGAGVCVHAVQHCVANGRRSPGRYRMLFESAPGRRRLFRKGDSYHPEREGGKIIPEREDMPHRYEGLIAWYENWSSAMAAKAKETDPLLSLRGSGKKLCADEHADEYVPRLPQGWQLPRHSGPLLFSSIIL